MKKYLFILFITLSSITCEKYEKIIAVKTGIFSDLTANYATIGGTIGDVGNGIKEHGHCWSKSNQNPTPENCDGKTTLGSKNDRGDFSSQATNLRAGTKYYFSAYATDENGSVTGNAYSFTTLQGVAATISTTNITSITTTTASSGGDITSDGGSAITARGVCWSTSTSPIITNSKTTDANGTGSFTSIITGLTANTKYYVRAYATNSVGTAYGNEVSLTTYAIMDIDGNGYHSVTIGTQTWMLENLATTKFNDGTTIPHVTDKTAWTALTTPAYCWSNNDGPLHKATYGALYNWYAIDHTANGGKKLCPTGWHVPTDAEWTTLTTYLGSETVAGGKMKEAGTLHWLVPNSGADNSSGFTALPGGSRDYNGEFHDMGDKGYWWSSTENSATHAWYRYVGYNKIDVTRVNDYKIVGISVRCLRD